VDLAAVTPVVLSLDEAPNIRRCLARLALFPCVIVLDSGSTDGTVDDVARFGNAGLHHRPFDTHATQWNHAVGLAGTDWVLSLDSDYMLSEQFISELSTLDPPDDVVAYFAPFRYIVLGKPLARSVLPPRALLFRRSMCRYVDDGHTQLLDVPGKAESLSTPIDHDDRKSLERWLHSQGRYARLEADKLADTVSVGSVDKVRRWKWLAPLAIFFYVLATGGLRSGWRGLYYAQQRMIAEAVQSLYLIERELEAQDPDVTE
jgi:glycosyltransferase involved in cell wall biosynthesis